MKSFKEFLEYIEHDSVGLIAIGVILSVGAYYANPIIRELLLGNIYPIKYENILHIDDFNLQHEKNKVEIDFTDIIFSEWLYDFTNTLDLILVDPILAIHPNRLMDKYFFYPLIDDLLLSSNAYDEYFKELDRRPQPAIFNNYEDYDEFNNSNELYENDGERPEESQYKYEFTYSCIAGMVLFSYLVIFTIGGLRK